MLTPYYVHVMKDHQKKKTKDPSLNAPTLTPYYVHALQDHQKKKRAQPQGTYAHALLRTRHTNPQSVGVLARKVFEHFNEYGVKKKQLNLRAIGLDSSVG